MKDLPGNTRTPFLRYGIKRWLIIALLSSLPWAGFAETAYVTDRLLAAVYRDKAQDSTVLEVLPTGAALTVLSRDGDFARVRTASGIVGWVDVNYLMSEKPAQLVLMELEAENDFFLELESRLGFGLPRPSTKQKWGLLIFGFLLTFVLGGYLADRIIRHRYYLIERGRKQHRHKARRNIPPRDNKNRAANAPQHSEAKQEKEEKG